VGLIDEKSGLSGESSRRPWDFSPYAKKFREEAGGAMYAMQWIPRLERIIEDRELPIAMRINAAYDRFCNAHLSHCMVDGLPPLKPGDRSPSKINLAKLAEILHEPVSTVSMANKLLREHLLARPAGEDGALYTEHTVQESLFAVQRENPPASPLDSSAVGGSPNPLLQWKAFEKQWFDANPGEAARVRTLGAEREELRRQQKELSEDIDEIKRRPLKAWKRYLSAAASDSRNGTVHGVETDSSPAPAPPEAPPSGSPEQNVHDSPRQKTPSPALSTNRRTQSLIGKTPLRRRLQVMLQSTRRRRRFRLPQPRNQQPKQTPPHRASKRPRPPRI
jgi:hypothetical protein